PPPRLSTSSYGRCTRPVLHRPVEPSQHTSYDFGKSLRTSGVLTSMCRVGSAYDNALAETAFATLKTELVYPKAWGCRYKFGLEVLSYIEGFHSTRRRHSRLDRHSPADHEERQLTDKQAVRRTGVTSGPPRLHLHLARVEHVIYYMFVPFRAFDAATSDVVKHTLVRL
uniref:IS3 family transposase n=1 Tax=uncultured Pseudokineococcus sp. TaxID=1642928 RepID=UPI0034517854